MQKLPVLVTFFNRPSHLEKLLISLKNLCNAEFYFSSDGPRTPKDKLNLELCLELIDRYFPNIPKGRFLQRDLNVGCKLGMKSNIDWFFDHVSYGIILEDDCIPNENFINLTGKMLLENFNNPVYMSINGTNFYSRINSESAFRETFFPMVWGWGTWASQWKRYELEIPDASAIIKSASNRIFGSKFSINKKYFENVFTTRFMEVERGLIDTWDYSLTASAWRHGIKSLQLNYNSILNIGFDSAATHTMSRKPSWVPISYAEVNNFGRQVQLIDYESEHWIIKNVYGAGLKQTIKNQVKRTIR
jgi:hypothetical protein